MVIFNIFVVIASYQYSNHHLSVKAPFETQISSTGVSTATPHLLCVFHHLPKAWGIWRQQQKTRGIYWEYHGIASPTYQWTSWLGWGSVQQWWNTLTSFLNDGSKWYTRRFWGTLWWSLTSPDIKLNREKIGEIKNKTIRKHRCAFPTGWM